MSLVILRSEYLKLIQTHSSIIAELPKAVQFCAAKLIQYFQHWSNWKHSRQRTLWIYQPFRKIHEDLMGEHSLHTIRAAIAILEQLGILKRRHNPSNGQDKTWQYRLKQDVLEQLLNQESCSELDSSYNVLSEHGTFRTEQGEDNVEQQSQDQSISISPTTTNEEVVVEKEVVQEVNALREVPSRKHCIDFEEYAEAAVFARGSGEILSPEISHSGLKSAREKQHTESADMTNDSSTPPTTVELREVLEKLRSMNILLNFTVRQIVKTYFTNCEGAIAHIQERIRSGETFRCLEAAFVKACKEGAKLESTQGAQGIEKQYPRPTPEQLQKLQASGKKLDYIATPNGIGGYSEVLYIVPPRENPISWWEFLGVIPCPKPT